MPASQLYRTVIVGCDGSEREADAIALAQQLRDPRRGRLILVNTFALSHLGASPRPGGEDAPPSDPILDRAEANVTYGVPCERARLVGLSTVAAINDLARATDADLIVLGTYDVSSSHLAVGNAAGRLLRGAQCAVAVATPGQHARFGAAPCIGVAYDASPEAVLALDRAYGVAAATGASTRLLTVLEHQDDEAGRAAGAALDEATAGAPAGVTVERRVLTGPVTEAIGAAAEDCDLLVTGSRGYGALHRALVSSITAGLLRDGHAPLLIVPRVLAAQERPPASGAPATVRGAA